MLPSGKNLFKCNVKVYLSLQPMKQYNNIIINTTTLFDYVHVLHFVSVSFLLFVWCPCMAINAVSR